MVKAIIFDCFGVLAEDGWMPFKRKYIEPGSEVARQITKIGDRTDLGHLNHEVMIKEMSNLTGTDPAILRHAISTKIPNEELFELIRKELKPKYKIGLITNGSYNVLIELFSPDQAVLFDATVISYESNLKKPDPRAYRLAAERLGVSISECLFIDDQERHVIGAREAGAQAMLYPKFEQFKAELHKYL